MVATITKNLLASNPLILFKERRDKLTSDAAKAKESCFGWFVNTELKSKKVFCIDVILQHDLTKIKSEEDIVQIMINNPIFNNITKELVDPKKVISILKQGFFSRKTANLLKDLYKMNKELPEIVNTPAGSDYQTRYEKHLSQEGYNPNNPFLNIAIKNAAHDFVKKEVASKSGAYIAYAAFAACNPYEVYFGLTYSACLFKLWGSKEGLKETDARLKAEVAQSAVKEAYEAYKDVHDDVLSYDDVLSAYEDAIEYCNYFVTVKRLADDIVTAHEEVNTAMMKAVENNEDEEVKDADTLAKALTNLRYAIESANEMLQPYQQS